MQEKKKYNPIILQKDICCGCGACVSACPKKCLGLSKDELKFRKVILIDEEKCVSCGRCSAVCPIYNKKRNTSDVFKRFYGQIYDINVLNESSSGGAFSAVSQTWIENGGIVWGVATDEKANAKFICVQKLEDLHKIRGSKYVEVNQPMPFLEIKKQLDEGKRVLVSGVPCQIRALSTFLQKEYKNLLLVDLLCYGVQSPLIWEKYLSEINPGNKKIKSVFMRYKFPRWEDYAIKIDYLDGTSYVKSRWKDPYLLTYAKSLYTRESCGACKAKEFPRDSDITLGDFWQIDTIKRMPNDIEMNRGVSVLLVNSTKGLDVVGRLEDKMNLFEIPNDVFPNMKARYSECHCRSEMSEAFVKDVNEIGFDEAVRKYIVKKDMIKERSRFQWLRIKRWIKRFLGILRR